MGNWKYHQVTEPSSGLILVEFNRYAQRSAMYMAQGLMVDHRLMRFMMSMSTPLAMADWEVCGLNYVPLSNQSHSLMLE